MPLYEFECRDCARIFEELCPAGAARKPPCPGCRSRRVRKVMSTFAVRRSGTSSAGSVSACSTCTGGDCSRCR